MLNNIHLYSAEQSDNSRYHRSNRSTPAMAISNGIQQHSDNKTHHGLSPIQCSAYFISRVDLSNYAVQTLKQTIDNILSGSKSKGLKVKLSLPDDGLIINNVPDPNQSWMYRTSELLYFWRDPYYVNIIIVITLNRTTYQTTGPYSASIFRLRGNQSVQLFLQRVQQFFAQLLSRNNAKTSFEKSATMDPNKKHHRRRSRHHSKSKKELEIRSSPLIQTTPAPHVSQAEFDPKEMPATDSFFNQYNRRTYSETTVSSDAQTSTSKQLNSQFDDDEKMTTVSNYLPNEYLTELVRELKELRSEIAALKLDARFTAVRSTNTSPSVVNEGHSKQRTNSSQSEIDAETQTDFSLIDNETKTNLSNENSLTNKRKNEQLNTKLNKRPLLNGTHYHESDREEPTLVNSSSHTREDYQPTSYPSRHYSLQKPSQNGWTVSNPKSIEKDVTSVPMDAESSLPIQSGEVVSFRSSLEDTIASPENIYENIPIFIPIDSNPNTSTNGNDPQRSKPYLHVTIADDPNSQLQQQYLSQLFGPQNGISLLIPPDSLKNPMNTSLPTPPETVIPNNQSYFQQALFSDHLTNPLFNVDKQLLANTIANQFGIDSNSAELQKLITNQHLFVANKRTFANMIWPITMEEENALCSSAEATAKTIDIQTIDSNSSTTKPILKPKKSSRLTSKGPRISWDSALE